ncbi:MAG: PH domain-containing protein [Candidatus Omnitrophica bacterium]|nr:PH domain-containing protein [Candidatus Omnitrophota bacterium]
MAEESHEERYLLKTNPSMFRNHPFYFVLLLILVPLTLGLALIVFLIWWIKCKSVRLHITDERSLLIEGILSRYSTEVRHEDVRNLQVEQGAIQRIFGVGRIEISSAGQSTMEIVVNGVPDPQGIADLIRKHQD